MYRSYLASVMILAVMLVAMSAGAQSSPPPVLGTVNLNLDAFVEGVTVQNREPSVATNGAGTWIAAWAQGAEGGGRNMITRTSTDNGATWGPEVMAKVYNQANVNRANGGQPDIAYSDGVWVLTWMSRSHFTDESARRDIGVVVSSDDGATWSDPVNLTADTPIGTDYNPRVVGQPGQEIWAVVWNTAKDPVGGDRDVRYTASEDDGANWYPVDALGPFVPDESNLAGDYPPISGAYGNQRFMFVWSTANDFTGTAGSDLDIGCRSWVLDGSGFNDISYVNTTFAGDTVVDKDPYVGYNSVDNTWMVVWTTETDIYSATSADDGATWSDPVLVSQSTGSAANTLRPALAFWDGGAAETAGMGAGGTWACTWSSEADYLGAESAERDVFVAFSNDNGETWGTAALVNEYGDTPGEVASDREPRIAFGGDGQAMVVWYNQNAAVAMPGSNSDRNAWYAILPYGADNDDDGVINGLEGVDAYQDPDSDYNGDGIPNSWYHQYGYDPTISGLRETVLDPVTGFTLGDAYDIGADPTNPDTWPEHEEPEGLPVAGVGGLLMLAGVLGAAARRRIRRR